MAVIRKRVNWHQLDRRNSEPRQIVDHGRGCQRRICATHSSRNVRMPKGKTLDVYLVNDRAVPGRPQSAIRSPGKRRVGHDALKHSRSAVPSVERKISVAVTDAISEM